LILRLSVVKITITVRMFRLIGRRTAPCLQSEARLIALSDQDIKDGTVVRLEAVGLT
jgi:hypothetical protein